MAANQELPTASTTVTYGTQAGSGSESISVELNEVRNNMRTEFDATDPVYVNVYNADYSASSGGTPIIAQGAGGSVSADGIRLSKQVSEVVTFNQAKTTSLRNRAIAGSLQFEWKYTFQNPTYTTEIRTRGHSTFPQGPAASNTAALSDDGTSVMLGTESTGSAKVTYNTLYDCYRLQASSADSEDMTALFFTPFSSATQTITFKVKTRKKVTLYVKDFCTERQVTNTTVTVTGTNGFSFTGISDTEGKVYLGELQSGTYNLVMAAAGYQPSATDGIANDSFTI